MPEYIYDKLIDFIPWSEHFNTGVDELDLQHRRLVHILNALVTNIAFQSTRLEINSICDDLTDYLCYHFQTEEVIRHKTLSNTIQTVDYDKKYEVFIAKVRELKEEINTTSSSEKLHPMLSFLIQWLIAHILESVKYSPENSHYAESDLEASEQIEQENNEVSKTNTSKYRTKLDKTKAALVRAQKIAKVGLY